jgi:hypothetical protein
MVAKKQLIGMKFGSLTVIRSAGSNKNGRALWLCRCDCGEERIATGKDLGKKVTRCPKKCMLTENLAGQQIGNLLILKQEDSDKHGFRQFRCRCITPLATIANDREELKTTNPSGCCGNEILINAAGLKQNLKHLDQRKVPKCCKRCSRILAGKLRREQNSMEDLAGQTFGRLTAVRKLFRGDGTYKRPMYECICSCGSGKIPIVRREALIGKSVKPIRSCGCLRTEALKRNKTNLIHGLTRHPLHIMWCGMRARCEQVDNPAYRWYGGRGIKICKLWEHFIEFYKWGIAKEWHPGLSIDRIDNDGPYSPENCQFITRAKNALKMQHDRGNGFLLSNQQVNINELSQNSCVSADLCKKLLSNGYSEADIFAYGKLKLHQKNAVGRSIHKGAPITIAEASERKRISRHQLPQSSELGSYYAMRARCHNPKDSSYRNYGVNGIQVCQEWKHNPTQFLLDMGPKPEPKKKYALDRIDPSKGYSSHNCRWLDSSENVRRVVKKKSPLSTKPKKASNP